MCISTLLWYTSALTPDEGLINGVGELSQGKHISTERTMSQEIPLKACSG